MSMSFFSTGKSLPGLVCGATHQWLWLECISALASISICLRSIIFPLSFSWTRRLQKHNCGSLALYMTSLEKSAQLKLASSDFHRCRVRKSDLQTHTGGKHQFKAHSIYKWFKCQILEKSIHVNYDYVTQQKATMYHGTDHLRPTGVEPGTMRQWDWHEFAWSAEASVLLMCLFLNLFTCLEWEFLKLDTKFLNSTVFDQHLLKRSKNIIYFSNCSHLLVLPTFIRKKRNKKNKQPNCAIERKKETHERRSWRCFFQLSLFAVCSLVQKISFF